MTDKEKLELFNLRKRVQSQREEIKRLQNVAESIHCKDCYCCEDCDDKDGWCCRFDSVVEPNGFCKWGKRREEVAM